MEKVYTHNIPSCGSTTVHLVHSKYYCVRCQNYVPEDEITIHNKPLAVPANRPVFSQED